MSEVSYTDFAAFIAKCASACDAMCLDPFCTTTTVALGSAGGVGGVGLNLAVAAAFLASAVLLASSTAFLKAAAVLASAAFLASAAALDVAVVVAAGLGAGAALVDPAESPSLLGGELR